MGMRVTIVGAALLLVARPAAGQFGLRAAEGTTSLIQSRSGYTVVAVDTKDESLNVVHRSGVFGRQQEWFNQAKLSLSAPGGERDLFSGGGFVPGVQIQNRLAWSDFGEGVDEADEVEGVPATAGANSGFTTLFGSVAYEINSNSMARLSGAAGDELILEDRTGQSLSVGGGLNWARDVTASWWGLAADVKWGWGVPASSRASQVCLTQSTAPASGQAAVVSRCGSRYFGEVRDRASAHFRLDWQSPYLPRITQTRVNAVTTKQRNVVNAAKRVVDQRTNHASAVGDRHKSAVAALATAWRNLSADPSRANVQAVATAQSAVDKAASDVRAASSELKEAEDVFDAAEAELEKATDRLTGRNTVTLLGALSSDVTDGDRPRYNVAVGPSLHPAWKPLNVVGALLFEMSDVTGSSDWRERFSVRLYLGLPFGGGGLK